jgi:O-antigen ligase
MHRIPFHRFAVTVWLLLFVNAGVANAIPMLLPAGVEQPTRAVYPSLDEPGCCWLGPGAAFSIERPAGADRLMVDFVLPPYAAGPKPTVLTLTALGRTQRACCFGPGEHQAAFILAGGPAGHFRAVLASSSQFVPAEKGLNQDRRVLTILLKRVMTIDSASGEAYIGTEPFSSNLLLPRWRVIFDAVCLGATALVMIALLRRPRWAWIALLMTAPFLFPVPIYGTTITVEKVVIILAAIAMLARKDFRAAIVRGPGRWVLAALIVFAVDMALSAVTAHYRAAALRETLKGAEYAAAFAIAYGAYAIDPDESVLRTALTVLACLVSVLAFAQPSVEMVQRTMFLGHVVPRIAGPLEGPNQLGAFLGIVLVALIGLTKRYSASFALALALGGFAMLFTLSRGSIFAFVLGAAVVLATRLHPDRRVAIASAAAVLCAVVLGATVFAAVTFPNPSIDRLFGSSDAYNGGLGSRVALWHAAIQLWKAHPLLGVGPGNFELLVGSLLPGVRTHPNGYYFQVLAEQGAAGIVLFGALFITGALIFARSRTAPYAAAGFAVVLTLAFHQLLDGLLPYPKVGLEFWGVVACLAAALSIQTPPAVRGA